MASGLMSRREMLRYSGIGLGAALLPLGLQRVGLLGADQPGGLVVRRAGDGGATLRSLAVQHFQVPLPIPSVLPPMSSDATTDYYEVSIRQATQQILPGLSTTIWGYNGLFPAPRSRPAAGGGS